MGRAIDLFTDEVLDDAVARLARRDIDRAWGRSDCAAIDVSSCTQLVQALRGRHRAPTAQVTLNQLRGRCAEQRLIRRLCERGYNVQNQLPIRPATGRGSVLDVQPLPGGRRRLPAGLEVKHLQLRNPRGQLRPLPVVQAAVRRHVSQVRRHMAQLPPGAGLPARIRLIYLLGGRISDAEFRQYANTIYAAAAAAPGTPAVQATVLRSGRLTAFRR